MDGQHGKRVRILTCVVAAVAVAFTWAGAAAPAWSAAHGMRAGVRPPGAGDVSAVGVARLAGSWGRAIEVPGLGALNTGRVAEVASVSCGSAGSCAAGGYYRDRRGHRQGFVVVEKNGRWGRAIEVPGLAALNKGGNAAVSSVSCGSAGGCAAGGYYRDRHLRQGFVAVERDGRWGRAIEVPGLAALNTGGDAWFSRCRAPRRAAARPAGTTGRPRSSSGVRGRRAARPLGPAIEVPGLGALNKGGDAWSSSVSCASAGSCAAGGDYSDAGSPQGFVASRAARRLGPGDRGARPGGAEQGRGRRGLLGVVRLGGQLRGRRGLPGPPRQRAGVRGRRAERRLGHSDRGARPGGPEQGAGAAAGSPRCRAPRRAAARPAGTTRTAATAGRGSWPSSGTASGARRSRCPAWEP